MTIKVNFELSSFSRNARTSDSITTDWDFYLRGINDMDLSPFVEKVIFSVPEASIRKINLEPPFTLYGSGYRNITIKVDIYLKNDGKRTKLRATHAIELKRFGLPMQKIEIKEFIIDQPSHELKKCLENYAANIKNREKIKDTTFHEIKSTINDKNSNNSAPKSLNIVKKPAEIKSSNDVKECRESSTQNKKSTSSSSTNYNNEDKMTKKVGKQKSNHRDSLFKKLFSKSKMVDKNKNSSYNAEKRSKKENHVPMNESKDTDINITPKETTHKDLISKDMRTESNESSCGKRKMEEYDNINRESPKKQCHVDDMENVYDEMMTGKQSLLNKIKIIEDRSKLTLLLKVLDILE